MKSPLKEDICNCIAHVIKKKKKVKNRRTQAKVFWHDKNGASATNMGRADKFPSAGSVKFIVHPWSFEKQTYMARQANTNFFFLFF